MVPMARTVREGWKVRERRTRVRVAQENTSEPALLRVLLCRIGTEANLNVLQQHT